MNVVALPRGLRRFLLADLPVEPWRNGSGQTRQIAAAETVDGDWNWRVSLADIRSSGPFSVFSGIDRLALLAEGEQLTLRSSETALHFRRIGDSHGFEGERELSAELAAGPVRLFNVMTRRGHATAGVSVHQGGTELSLADGETLILLVTSGEFCLSFRGARPPSNIERQVGLGEGLQVSDLAGAMRVEALSLDACLLAAQLSLLGTTA